MADERAPTTVRLELEEGYRFSVDLGEAFEPIHMDEPPPIGDGSGPSPAAVLGAAVGNCLSASLLYCLRRAHLDVEGLAADVQVTPARDERGRLRIGSIAVRLQPVLPPGSDGRMARCLELFEDFCVVTASVRGGIDVDVAVDPVPAGRPDPASRPSQPDPAGHASQPGQPGQQADLPPPLDRDGGAREESPAGEQGPARTEG